MHKENACEISYSQVWEFREYAVATVSSGGSRNYMYQGQK